MMAVSRLKNFIFITLIETILGLKIIASERDDLKQKSKFNTSLKLENVYSFDVKIVKVIEAKLFLLMDFRNTNDNKKIATNNTSDILKIAVILIFRTGLSIKGATLAKIPNLKKYMEIFFFSSVEDRKLLHFLRLENK